MSEFSDAAGKVKFEIEGLKNIKKFFENGMPKVQVGILGDKDVRKAVEHTEVKSGKNKGKTKAKTISLQKASSMKSNSEIGYENEFGVMSGPNKKPKRSFIIYPLTSKHFKDTLKEKKSLTKKAFEKAVKTGKIDEFVGKVGFVAEETIQTAFETGGWGNWVPNSPTTIAMKGSASPLIDSAQLRKAITSKVIKKGK